MQVQRGEYSLVGIIKNLNHIGLLIYRLHAFFKRYVLDDWGRAPDVDSVIFGMPWYPSMVILASSHDHVPFNKQFFFLQEFPFSHHRCQP